MSKKSEYLGKGATGCVIKPGLQCKDGENFGDDTISKLFDDEHLYEKEVKINDIIKRLDPDNKFTIKIFSNCSKKISETREKVDDIQECTNLRSKNIYQIVYEYGGIDFFNLIKSQLKYISNIFDFFKNMIKIFEGIKKLSDNNFIHFDIKIDNLLYNPKKSKIVLIDFGSLKNVNEFFNNVNKYNLYINGYYSPHYPMEFKLLTYILLKYDVPNLNSNIETYIKNVNIKLNEPQSSYNDIRSKHFDKFRLLQSYLHNKSINYINYFRTKYRHQHINLFEIKELEIEMCKKIDVYQMGLVLSELLLATLLYKSEDEIKTIPFDGIFILLRGMIEPNPFERFSIDEVIKLYSELFNIDDTIEQPKQEQKLEPQLEQDDIANWDKDKLVEEFRKIGYDIKANADTEDLKNKYPMYKQISSLNRQKLFDALQEFNIYLPNSDDIRDDTLKKILLGAIFNITKGGMKSIKKADIIKILLVKYPNMKNLKSMKKNELMALLKKKVHHKAQLKATQ